MSCFACSSSYIMYTLYHTKYARTRHRGKTAQPPRAERISKKATLLALDNQKLPLREKQVGKQPLREPMKEQVFLIPTSNTVCVGRSRRQVLPVESCPLPRGSRFSQANSLTGTIASLTAHARSDWALRITV